jgi:glycosyltransferase involved in cell wall biosynthesis
MKVVFVTSESFIDHSYTIVKELRSHCDLTVFFQAKELSEENEKWCKEFNAVFIKRKRFRNPIGFFGSVSFILKLRRLRAEAYWFNTLTFYQSLIVKFLIKKFLVTVHDVEIHPGLKDFNVKLSQRMTITFYKKNICVASKSQAEIFRNHFGYVPLLFQLPVIDYYTRREATKPTVKQIKKLSFLFFGSIELYKGIFLLLDAAKILNDNNCDFTVNICGKIKTDKDLFIERIKNINNVNLQNIFVPYRQVSQVYEENDVLVLPYLQVTQCGPLLIGYNQNKPAICNHLPGFREYVDDNKSGLFFDGTADNLAEQMKKLIDNPSLVGNMSRYISEDVKQKFGMNALIKVYLNNFDKTILEEK